MFYFVSTATAAEPARNETADGVVTSLRLTCPTFRDSTIWLTARARGRVAATAMMVHDGDRVTVAGRLSTRMWTDGDGTRRWHDLELLSLDLHAPDAGVPNQVHVAGQVQSIDHDTGTFTVVSGRAGSKGGRSELTVKPSQRQSGHLTCLALRSPIVASGALVWLPPHRCLGLLATSISTSR